MKFTKYKYLEITDFVQNTIKLKDSSNKRYFYCIDNFENWLVVLYENSTINVQKRMYRKDGMNLLVSYRLPKSIHLGEPSEIELSSHIYIQNNDPNNFWHYVESGSKEELIKGLNLAK